MRPWRWSCQPFRSRNGHCCRHNYVLDNKISDFLVKTEKPLAQRAKRGVIFSLCNAFRYSPNSYHETFYSQTSNLNTPLTPPNLKHLCQQKYKNSKNNYKIPKSSNLGQPSEYNHLFSVFIKSGYNKKKPAKHMLKPKLSKKKITKENEI